MFEAFEPTSHIIQGFWAIWSFRERVMERIMWSLTQRVHVGTWYMVYSVWCIYIYIHLHIYIYTFIERVYMVYDICYMVYMVYTWAFSRVTISMTLGPMYVPQWYLDSLGLRG